MEKRTRRVQEHDLSGGNKDRKHEISDGHGIWPVIWNLSFATMAASVETLAIALRNLR